MPDIDAFLKQLSQIGEPVEETAFTEIPPMPYIVFSDTKKVGGADYENGLVRHSITIERYSETRDGSESLETLLKESGAEYTESSDYLKELACFVKTYELEDALERK